MLSKIILKTQMGQRLVREEVFCDYEQIIIQNYRNTSVIIVIFSQLLTILNNSATMSEKPAIYSFCYNYIIKVLLTCYILDLFVLLTYNLLELPTYLFSSIKPFVMNVFSDWVCLAILLFIAHIYILRIVCIISHLHKYVSIL